MTAPSAIFESQELQGPWLQRLAARPQVCMNMLRAGIIVQRVDVTQQLFPGVAAAALFVGTIAAAGGKLLVDTIDHLTGDVKGALRGHAVPSSTKPKNHLASASSGQTCKRARLAGQDYSCAVAPCTYSSTQKTASVHA
jgi:hypothetical protein